MMPDPFLTGCKVVRRFLAWCLFLAVVLGGGALWWLHAPMPMGEAVLELEIEPGTTPRGVA